MSRFPQPLTHLVHENLSILMTFAFSRGPLEHLRTGEFRGEWKYLDRALFEVSAQRAEKACLEIATYLRILDDEENINSYLKNTSCAGFGTVHKDDGSIETMYFRDLTNKIVHAKAIEWDWSESGRPMIVCEGRDPVRWVKAEIDVVSLAALCGQLMA